MYLEHFGLKEPPFRITPVTVFFFSGANRGEILDALIYSISEVEGIIKVSGEVGSGKTMLCRMLLERLPGHIEAIYLANPSLTREEMLYAIADGLGLNIRDERVGIIMQSIQNRLEEKARSGKRVVVLVDEAHAMPTETLEELRLLYNLQVGNAKLMQIVLFGQPELNAKLESSNMRQLKDRIAHHFHMQPLSRDILENYLMFRMRAAGYHGPNIFSSAAIKHIAEASNGLMRRVNILADKSLLAAFVEDTHNIEAHHVKAAMRDSELRASGLTRKKAILLAAALTGLLAAAMAALMLTGKLQTAFVSPATLTSDAPASDAPPLADTSNPAAAPQKTVSASATSAPSMFEQRMSAGKRLAEQKKAVASLQLFYNEEIRQDRIEGFLRRAERLGKLSDIYLLPAKFGDKDGLRVLYGAYGSTEEALAASKNLPTPYQNSFAPSIYIF
ncbi:MAG TPA: AAA family ATPase [Gallionella sp.]